MKEKVMQKVKKAAVIMMAVVMVGSVTTPKPVSAATKKTISVSMKNTTADIYQIKVPIKNKKARMGSKGTYQLTVKYAGKSVTKKTTYKTSNKKVATVSKTGKITTKKAGTATITVKYKTKSTKIKLTVHNHSWKAHKTYYEEWTGEWENICDYCGQAMDDSAAHRAEHRAKGEYVNPVTGGGSGSSTLKPVMKKCYYTDYWTCKICGVEKIKVYESYEQYYGT